MFFQQAAQIVFPEDTLPYQGGVKQIIAHKRVKLVTEPVGDWEHKSLLFPGNDLPGEKIAGDPAQDIFQLAAADLHVGRQGGHEFYQLVIQQGRAQFQAVGHGHAVGEHQRVLRQAGFHVGIDHLIDQIFRPPAVKMLQDDRRRVAIEIGPQDLTE